MDNLLRAHLKIHAPLHHAALLFAPREARESLLALYIFDAEIKRIPALVSEPMLGEIRLQWWRDVVEGKRDDEARLNPFSDALVEAMTSAKLPASGLMQLIDAESRMLDPAPMVEEKTLEAHYGARFGTLFQLSLLALGLSPSRHAADASGHAGMAYGIARDLMSGQHAVLRSDLIALGEAHLQKAKSAIAVLSDAARIAVLPLVITQPVFDQARNGNDGVVLRTPSPLVILWRMMRFKI
jgi:phytoene/squalene synthetase